MNTRPQQQPRGNGPLAAIRLRRKLSRPQLVAIMAKRCGLRLHPNAIGMIESGRQGTRLEVVTALAVALGVTEQTILDAIKACRVKYSRANGAAA